MIAAASLEAAPDDVIPVELTTFVTVAIDSVAGITFRLDGEEAAAGCAYWLLYGTESDPAFFLGTELRLGANAQALGELGRLDENGTATIQIPWPGYAEVYYFQAVIARNDQALYQGDAWVTDVLAIRADGEAWTEWTAPTSAGIPSPRQTYIVATDASYPPFEWVGTTGALYGFDLDLMRCIALLQDFEITTKNVDWSIIFDEVADGLADIGASGARITPERESKLDFSAPYWIWDQVLLVSEGSGVTGFSSLTSGQRVGVLYGESGYDLAVYTLELHSEIVEYDGLEAAALGLSQGLIDALIVDQTRGQALVAGNPAFVLIDTFTADDDFYTGQYGFFVGEGDPQGLLDKLDSSLQTLKEVGVYDNLVRAYTGSPLAEIETAWQESSHFLHEKGADGTLKSVQDFADSMVRLTSPTLARTHPHPVKEDEPRSPDETESADGPGEPDGEPIEGGPGNDPLPAPWPPQKPDTESAESEEAQSAPEGRCVSLRMTWLGAEDVSIEAIERWSHLPLVIVLINTCEEALEVTSLAVTDQGGQIVETIWQSEENPIRIGVDEEVRWYWKTPALLPAGKYVLLATSSVGELQLRFDVID